MKEGTPSSPAHSVIMRNCPLRILILVLTVICSATSALAEDILLLRNGEEARGKLELVSDKEVAFSVKSGNFFSQQSERVVVPATDVYMIKTDKRGTIFFDREYKRKSTETQKHDKSADLIYLADGGEIPAWSISIANGVLSYQKDKKKVRAMSNIGAIRTEEVFMVKYSDGSKDLFTDISAGSDKNAKSAADSEENVKIKVVMYNVQTGENLGAIAQKFNVSVAEIKEWNDLPVKYNDISKPVAGTQLMIQTKIKESN